MSESEKATAANAVAAAVAAAGAAAEAAAAATAKAEKAAAAAAVAERAVAAATEAEKPEASRVAVQAAASAGAAAEAAAAATFEAERAAAAVAEAEKAAVIEAEKAAVASAATAAVQGDEAAAEKGATGAEGSEVLDATVADDKAAPALSELEENTYDPDKYRDATRSYIAYWLLGLLTVVVVFSFTALIFISNGAVTFENLKSLLELLLGPIIALVSAATGFYFGSQQQNGTKKP